MANYEEVAGKVGSTLLFEQINVDRTSSDNSPAVLINASGVAQPPTVFDTGNTPNVNRTIPSGYGGGQSFLTTDTGQIQQAVIKMYQNGGATGTLTCEIWSDSAGLPDTLLGTSNTFLASSVSTNSGFPADNHTFTFTGGPTLSNATTYHAIINVTNATGTFTLKVTSSSTYGGGAQVESNDGISWTAPGGATLDCFLEITLQDITASGACVSSVNQDNIHFDLWEGSETNRIRIKTPSSITDYNFILPGSVGGAGTVLTDAAGDGNLSWTTPAGGFSTSIKTSTYTAVSGDEIFGDTDTIGAFTIDLPASATIGDRVRILDAKDNWATNNLTVGRNGHNINGDASDLVLDIDGAWVELIYMDVTEGWRIMS